MSDQLHPAVRDIAATGGVAGLTGAVVLAVALAVDPPAEVGLSAGVIVAIVAVLAPLRLPRAVRDILEDLRAAPDAPVDEGVGRAVWWTVPIIAIGLVAAALLSLPVAAVGALLLGAGGSELTEAWWLRRWERLNGRRLLYRSEYRWAGTNGRVLGRGWFDPANFVAS